MAESPTAHQQVCAYPWQQMIVDLTGEVVPCCFWSGYGNTGRPLGNTNTHTIAEIWNGPEYRSLRQQIVEANGEGFPCHQCMSARWSHGNYPPFTWPSPFVKDDGACYRTQILQSVLESAATIEGEWSLFEDGAALGPGDSIHDEIRRLGEGRFAVSGEWLYLSASDNSDPNVNDRRYELRRGDLRWQIRTTHFDSTSGRNLKVAHEEYQARAVTLTAKPTMLSFISTADCNIDCGMCSQNKVRKFKVQHRPETPKEVLELAPYLQQFVWQGGEPFLIEDFRKFYSTFRPEDNPNLTFGFTSNGTMISEKVLAQLLKFPRLNASVSVDSFTKESFERIRAGARFDVVLANLLRMMEHYDAPDRVFAVGAVVMKSNLLELAANIRAAQTYGLHLNLGPLVVYPVHERLDVFENFSRQTAGWAEALDDARVAAGGLRSGTTANDVSGMVEAIAAIVDDARIRHARTAPLTLSVEDPTGALTTMRLPGVIVYRLNVPAKPLGYVALNGPGTYALHAPEQELYGPDPLFAHFYHDLHDETDIVETVRLKHQGHPQRAQARLVVPAFTPPARLRNVRLSNAGRSRPDGLIVIDPALQL